MVIVITTNQIGLETAIKLGLKLDEKDEDGNNFLHLCCKSITSVAFKAILNSKYKDTFINEKNNEGQTPFLSLFLHDGLFEIGMLKALLDNGADINAVDNEGKTALLHACGKNMARKIDFLLEHNANVNIADNTGWVKKLAVIKE